MAASSLLMFPLAGCAALAALVMIASADAAALASPGADLVADDLIPATLLRARRQTTRYDLDSSVDEDDWAARAQQAVARYQNAVNRGWMPANSEEEDAARVAASNNNNNNNRNQQGSSSWSSPQQGRTRTRTSSNPSSARQTSNGSNGYRPATSSPVDQGYATRNAWGSGNGNNGDTNNGVFGGDSGSGGGVFGSNGGGLFGNRPSIIGGLIRRLGFGFANTVQGVSSALANKWNTKASAARAFASSLLNTGRVGLNSGLQAGLAHPRFAMEAVENVF